MLKGCVILFIMFLWITKCEAGMDFTGLVFEQDNAMSVKDIMSKKDAIRFANQVIWNHTNSYVEMHRRYLRDYITYTKGMAVLGSEPTQWQIRRAGRLMQQVEYLETAMQIILNYKRHTDKAMGATVYAMEQPVDTFLTCKENCHWSPSEDSEVCVMSFNDCQE